MATVEPIEFSPPDRIRPPLALLRGTIRRYVSLEGAARIGIFVALWFWIGLILDYGSFRLLAFDWVQELPRWFRGTVLAIILGSLTAVILRTLVRRLTVDFSAPSLALVLEKQFPEQLGDRLITAVELADVDRAEQLGYSRDMIIETVREAGERVATVPVANVFDWRRLKKLGLACVTWLIGPALALGIGYTAVRRTNPIDDYVPRLREIAGTWVRRNVLLQNVIWPRKAFLEVLDFPVLNDLRVGRDAAAPRLHFKARRWVVMDGAEPEGYRLMMWTDLRPGILGFGRPEFPLSFQGAAAAIRAASIIAAPDLIAAAEAKLASDEAWSIDRIEIALEDESFRKRLEQFDPDGLKTVEAVLDALREHSVQPSSRGVFRRLEVPDRVEVKYWGDQTSGRLELIRGPGWEYAGALGDLKESVKFRARGLDYFTTTRSITLVPPPTLQQLKRFEYRPAYLYHRPPLGDPPAGGPQALKGLKQRVEDFVSLNGPTSRFAVPSGTDVILDGQLDKPLDAIVMRSRINAGDSRPLDISADRSGFRHRFDNIVAPLDFELEFTDTDGVHSVRHIMIESVRDLPPVVNVAIDGIRLMKQGYYLVTPQALIPFDGKVIDGVAGAMGGLQRVEYQATVTRMESALIAGTQAGWLAAAATPVAGSRPDSFWIGAVATSEVVRQVQTAAPPVFEKNISLDTFEQLLKERSARDVTRAELLKRLDQEPAPPPLVKEFAVRPKFEGLDLRERLPELKVKSEYEVQPRYRMKLTMTATDNNIETGPGISTNKEPPFTVMIVSEAELLVEIALDEEKQHLKTEDAIARLREAKQNLGKVTGELSAAANEQLPTYAQRSQELIESAAKARDTVQEVSGEYNRILRELELNRVSFKNIEKVKGEICLPLESVLKADFPQAEEALEGFRRELEASRKPKEPEIRAAGERLDRLIDRLTRIMAAMGEVTTINKLIAALREIEKGQEQAVGNRLKELQRLQREKLLEKIKGIEDK